MILIQTKTLNNMRPPQNLSIVGSSMYFFHLLVRQNHHVPVRHCDDSGRGWNR